MSDMDINDHLDHQKWLLEHGFINDLHKDNLYMYGAILHKDIQAVQVDIDVAKKIVNYHLYVTPKLLNLLDKYSKLSASTGVIGLWRFKRLLSKHGRLDFETMLNNFIRHYCGTKWVAIVNIQNIRNYKDGFEEEKKRAQSGDGADKQLDQG